MLERHSPTDNAPESAQSENIIIRQLYLKDQIDQRTYQEEQTKLRSLQDTSANQEDLAALNSQFTVWLNQIRTENYSPRLREEWRVHFGTLNSFSERRQYFEDLLNSLTATRQTDQEYLTLSQSPLLSTLPGSFTEEQRTEQQICQDAYRDTTPQDRPALLTWLKNLIRDLEQTARDFDKSLHHLSSLKKGVESDKIDGVQAWEKGFLTANCQQKKELLAFLKTFIQEVEQKEKSFREQEQNLLLECDKLVKRGELNIAIQLLNEITTLSDNPLFSKGIISLKEIQKKRGQTVKNIVDTFLQKKDYDRAQKLVDRSSEALDQEEIAKLKNKISAEQIVHKLQSVPTPPSSPSTSPIPPPQPQPNIAKIADLATTQYKLKLIQEQLQKTKTSALRHHLERQARQLQVEESAITKIRQTDQTFDQVYNAKERELRKFKEGNGRGGTILAFDYTDQHLREFRFTHYKDVDSLSMEDIQTQPDWIDEQHQTINVSTVEQDINNYERLLHQEIQAPPTVQEALFGYLNKQKTPPTRQLLDRFFTEHPTALFPVPHAA